MSKPYERSPSHYRLQTEEHVREIAPQLLADRERRNHANDARSLTGKLLGDPPVGFSAADRHHCDPPHVSLSENASAFRDKNKS